MNRKVQFLLAADALINLLLGILLLLFPAGVLRSFGLPSTDTYFYTSLLGGVIFGIGLALGLEWLQRENGSRGLGLAGAILINLSGGGVLIFWLIFGNLGIPMRGIITLWIVAILVIGIGIIELISGSWRINND
jgi:hypothetical protein